MTINRKTFGKEKNPVVAVKSEVLAATIEIETVMIHRQEEPGGLKEKAGIVWKGMKEIQDLPNTLLPELRLMTLIDFKKEAGVEN